MTKLVSLDLFSGIGGFTLALSDWAKPLAYCDNDSAVQAMLADLMRRRRLPKAPVLSDVRDIDEIKRVVGSQKLDVITAGFPCVGFSTAGSKAGLDNDHSALFYDAAKVVAAFRPGMVFFENVKAVLYHPDDLKAICKTMRALGYDLKWTIVSAADVGAPQKRERWFCLCTRRGYECPVQVPKTTRPRFSWSPRSAPPLTAKHDPAWSKPMSMLGNAIVPDCARLAFVRLMNAMKLTVSSLVTPHGYVSRSGKRYAFDVQPVPPVPVHIVLDPDHYQTETPYRQAWRPKTPQYPHLQIRSSWPTPRAGSTGHTHVMTARTKNDLPTAAVFAREVNGKVQRKTRDGDGINIAFVEWLMGYPRGTFGGPAFPHAP